MKGFRNSKTKPLSEILKQQAKLHAKYKEYSEKTNEELRELCEILGGGYKQACLEVMKERVRKTLSATQSEELPDGEIK